ncbi:MAG: ion transporter [Lachnospiraceae bacterium]|nr:ion transporter [Lachnospiraceae bacterium]
MRKRIYEILEAGAEDDIASRIYDAFMMAVIIISIAPLMTKTENLLTYVINRTSGVIFIADYILRLVTADYKMKKGAGSFFLYPFTPMAVIDLICILPSIAILRQGFRVLKIARLIRTFRVFRIFKAFRYSRNVGIIVNVFRKQKESLAVVCMLAVGYIIVTALVMFNFEPDTFGTFFDALYWATISLATIGYGDLYATSTVGRMITMLSSLFGIAIVALPSGIITAGYMEEIKKEEI